MAVTDRTAADLAEFASLRQEIINRQTISYTLLALDLAAVGTGVSVANRNSHVLGALAVLTSVLWLFWTNNATMIQSMAVYIALDLAPRLAAEAGHPVLRWEVFMRRLFQGGDSASTLLFGSDPSRAGHRLSWPAGSDWYATVLLGGASPLLLAIYIGVNHAADFDNWLIIGATTVVAVIAWVYAATSFRGFSRAIRLFHQAIVAREQVQP